MRVTVAGGGLAGCEAAAALARNGIAVTLIEMKPHRYSPAHSSPGLSELVCSNSLKADRLESSSGLLKAEMRMLGSVTLKAADSCRVPAGGALAVDRERFSKAVTEMIESDPLIEVLRCELTELPRTPAIIATGPLTSDALSEAIGRETGEGALSFYDAAAPIVEADSIDMSVAFRSSRYDRGGDDYINCPFDRAGYEAFIDELLAAERAVVHEFDRPAVYEGCMPIEILASRGRDAARFGPMKPIGLTNPATGHRPWAVVQLRAENLEGTLYNLVGFQTNLKFPEQKRVFSMIPGLKNARFARYGVMHRNTFIDAPRLLDERLRLKSRPSVRFAGQITGVEGYMESAATGLFCGIDLARELKGLSPFVLPPETMLGALLRHTQDVTSKNYQPMGSSMGMLPELGGQRIRDRRQRYLALANRSLEALRLCVNGL